MTTAKEYRTHAKRCFVRAQETDSEELRQASLEMASYWMDAAMRTECLGDSRVEARTAGCLAQRIVNPLLNESRCSLCRGACCSRHRRDTVAWKLVTRPPLSEN